MDALRGGVRDADRGAGGDDAWQLPQFERELARAAAVVGERRRYPLRLADVRALLAVAAGRPPDPRQLPHRHPHRLHDGADALGAAPRRLPGRPRRRRLPAHATPSTATTCSARRPLHRRARRRAARTASCCSTRCSPPPSTLVITYTGANEHTGARRPPAVPLGELLDAARPHHRGAGPRRGSCTRHPLQPYDARNLKGRPAATRGVGRPELRGPVQRPFSFDRAALGRGARGRSARAPAAAAPRRPAARRDRWRTSPSPT